MATSELYFSPMNILRLMNRLFVLYLKPSLCKRTGLADVSDTEMLVLAQAVWGSLGARPRDELPKCSTQPAGRMLLLFDSHILLNAQMSLIYI